MPTTTYKEKFANLDAFLFDVDGVFSTGQVILLPDADPVRTFHSRDTYALQHALKEGMRIIIITGGHSEGVTAYFKRFGVTEFHDRVANKLDKLEELIATTGLDPARCAYMGDDIPDLRIMQRVAFPCCPNDAADEVKAISAFVSKNRGGHGCVRDLLEQAMKIQGKWMTEAAHTW